MRIKNQEVQKHALPAFFRRGLEAYRSDHGNEQGYFLRAKWKNQTYEFEPWQFFILEVLPGCDDITKLASVFEDRFGHIITEKEVEELLSMVADMGLFGVSAISHPMLAALSKKRPIKLGGAPSLESPMHAKAEKSNSRDVRVALEPKSAPVATGNTEANTMIPEEGQAQGHLERAMHKAQTGASYNNKSMTLPGPTLPAALSQEETDNHIHPVGVVSPKLHGDSLVTVRTESNVKLGAKPAVDALQKPLPAGVRDAVGLDNSMRKKGWKLFNPTLLIKLLQPLLSPFKYTIYLLPLLLIAALFITARHTGILTQDFKLLLFKTSFIKLALLSMITVNLSVTLLTALIADTYRATVSAFCIVFYMFFFPRFMVRIANVQQLLRRERIWLHAAPLLLRLGYFSVGILMWFNTRATHAVLSNFGLAVASASAISFIITVTPFIKSSGYHVLAATLNEPHLRRKAYRAFLNKFRSNVYSKADNAVLVAYALTSILYVLAITAAMLYIFGSYLKIQLGAVSVLVIVLIALMLLWRMIINFKKLEEDYERSVQFERWRNRTLTAQTDTIEKKPRNAMLVYTKRSILLLFLAALFLPYNYEPGGNFIVLPNEKQTVSAAIAGIVEKINYDGGEILTKGSVIGQLSHSDYASQVKIYTAKINQQQAVINELKSRPKPEEVRLAKSALGTQRTQAEFSKGKADRLRDLYEQEVVSFEDYEDARRLYEVDLDQVQEKIANLELVSSGATPDEMAEAEAKLQSYQEERDHYQAKIEQSVFHMPFDGKLITLHLKQRIGSYLDKGEPLAVAEQTNLVKVEIEIPESDIGYVKENSKIRCRFHVYHDEDFYGVVKTIDANVTEENYGKVIKIVTLLENKDERLKSGMTGYAKISAEKMPLWKVLSMALIRFVKVEVWSWLP